MPARLTRFLTLFVVFISGMFTFAATAAAQDQCTGRRIFDTADCAGDSISAEETALLNAVNGFRATHGLPAVKASAPLSRIANRRMLDLTQNMKTLTHSWSNCPYDISAQSTWGCMLDAPARFRSAFTGKAYETLYHGSSNRVEPARTIDMWARSDLHRSILLNQGAFARMKWREAGVGISGGYAAIWFGYADEQASDLGATLSGTLKGLEYLRPTALAPGQSIWNGSSADGAIRLKIDGGDGLVSQVVLSMSQRGGATSGEARFAAAAQLLRNLFPTWNDSDAWLRGVLNSATATGSMWRAKIVSDAAVEIRSEDGVVQMTIRPNAKKALPTEIN